MVTQRHTNRVKTDTEKNRQTDRQTRRETQRDPGRVTDIQTNGENKQGE